MENSVKIKRISQTALFKQLNFAIFRLNMVYEPYVINIPIYLILVWYKMTREKV